MPENHFFLLLADNYKEAVIGILFLGRESDGVGLKAIRMAGGITLVQKETAAFNNLPKHAIAEGIADLI